MFSVMVVTTAVTGAMMAELRGRVMLDDDDEHDDYDDDDDDDYSNHDSRFVLLMMSVMLWAMTSKRVGSDTPILTISSS